MLAGERLRRLPRPARLGALAPGAFRPDGSARPIAMVGSCGGSAGRIRVAVRPAREAGRYPRATGTGIEGAPHDDRPSTAPVTPTRQPLRQSPLPQRRLHLPQRLHPLWHERRVEHDIDGLSTRASNSWREPCAKRRRRLPSSSVASSQLQQRPPRFCATFPHRPNGPAPEATRHVATFGPLDYHRRYVTAPLWRCRDQGHLGTPSRALPSL